MFINMDISFSNIQTCDKYDGPFFFYFNDGGKKINKKLFHIHDHFWERKYINFLFTTFFFGGGGGGRNKKINKVIYFLL